MSNQGPLNLHLSEIFASIQGEGEFTGMDSVFVRLNGCNLRCHFCDTPYASWEPQGSKWGLEDLFATIRGYGIAHVVLTGGEPLLQPAVVPLVEMLRKKDHFITIETAATVYRNAPANLMSISPKRANSTPPEGTRWAKRHEEIRHQPTVIQKMLEDHSCQFKFVINTQKEIDDVIQYAAEFPKLTNDKIWLMPQAITKEELLKKEAWLKPLAEQHNFQYSSRLQIIQFGNKPGT